MVVTQHCGAAGGPDRVPWRTRRLLGLVALGLACRGDDRPVVAPPSPLEASIASALAKRYGVAIAVTCATPTACTGHAPGIALPIRVTPEGSAYDWWIDGLVVQASTIEAYVRTELGELGSAQDVACGARLHHVLPGERLVCELERGGKVFVTFGDDGASSFEIVLDPGAGAARAEPVTDARERELLELSRVLDEEVPTEVDAGVGDAGRADDEPE